MGEPIICLVVSPVRSAQVLAALLVTTASALSGCAQSDPTALQTRAVVLEASQALADLGETESAASLADGTIDYDEYVEAGRRYQSCLRDAGVAIEGPYLSPVDNVWLLWRLPDTIPGGNEVAEATQVCERRWRPVVAAYLDSHEHRMDQGLADEATRCMRSLGYELSGEESSVTELVGEQETRKSQRATDAERCIVEASQSLFPELPGVVVLY